MSNYYIIATENESLQKIAISNSEQIEKLQSMLVMEERMKEFELHLTGKNQIFHGSKLINTIRSLMSGESHEGASNTDNMVFLILFTNTSL